MNTLETALAPLPRLAVVLSHPTQYYSPWFRWLAEHTDLDFRVFYLWEFGVQPMRDPQFGTTFAWDVDLLSGYAHEFVPNIARDPGTHRFGGLRNPELPERLAAWQPDALLLFGYKHPSHLSAIFWARERRVPLIFRGDSHFLGRSPPRGLKRFLLRLLFRQFAAVTYVGAANRDYFTALGVPAPRLFFAPHAVDDGHFDPADHGHIESANTLRQALGLSPSTRVVLFAGKLVPAKQPRALLESFLAIRAPNTALVFVGDGDQKTALQARAAGAAPGTVHFLPFANQSEMPARYLLADLFVLPSSGIYETWGLAVNEAMHMGVPCLVSDRVGCQRDLVTDGETGWVFRADKRDALAERLRVALAALAVPETRIHIRAAVRTRVSGYSFERAAEGLRAALASIPARHHAS
ncbi:MAG TPA: glycosyltransferase family 4 protein [Opitutaceae bacterium]